MSEPTSSGRTVILAAVDTSANAEGVIQRALEASRQAPGADLHLVHVIDRKQATKSTPPMAASNLAMLQHVGREYLLRLLKEAQTQVPGARGHLVMGDPEAVILQLATNLQADLLVVGTHDPGKVEKMLLGSVAQSLVRKAPCQVLVVRPRREAHPDVPQIQPPCPDCLAVQRTSGGQQLWCERHAHHQPPTHTHYEYPDNFAVGSMTFRPS